MLSPNPKLRTDRFQTTASCELFDLEDFGFVVTVRPPKLKPKAYLGGRDLPQELVMSWVVL